MKQLNTNVIETRLKFKKFMGTSNFNKILKKLNFVSGFKTALKKDKTTKGN